MASLLGLLLLASPAAAQPTEHTVWVLLDGTFNPGVLHINEGDTVKWVNLDRRDAIIQVDAAAQTAPDPCLDHGIDYLGGDNEFTGPMRKAVPGIFALGPHYNHNDETLSPEQVGPFANPGTAACNGQVSSYEVQNRHTGDYYQLCRGTAANETMEVLWVDPDITGVTVRLNWNDLETSDDNYDWSGLEREMDAAVRHGKVFFLDIRMGGHHGTPRWIFNEISHFVMVDGVTHEVFEYPGGLATPVYLKDYADANQGLCGTKMILGSPTDLEYKIYQKDFIYDMIAHIRSNSAWFQAMAGLKVSGMNLFTSEARLPKRCLGPHDHWSDPDPTPAPGEPPIPRSTACWCNTRIWAEAGYTPEVLYNYYREMAHEIALWTGFQKSIGYQVIQDGFPRVVSPTNYRGDGNEADDIGSDTQSKAVMNLAQQGLFADLSNNTPDYEVGKLFVPQHSGLTPNPPDGLWVNDNNLNNYACPQQQAVTATHPYEATFPMDPPPAGGSWELYGYNSDPLLGDPNALGGVSSGCPNRWITFEGIYDPAAPVDPGPQVTGFQVRTDFRDLVDVNSALWNMTANSNGVFLEIYPQHLWEAFHTRGNGPSGWPLDEDWDDPSRTFQHPKSLHEWNEELIARRQWFATRYPSNPHLADPFPYEYRFPFEKDLNAGQTETYYYVNPRRCRIDGLNGGTAGPDRVGQIIVTGT